MSLSFPVNISTVSVSTNQDIIVYYPQVFNYQNQELEGFINNTIMDQVQQLVDQQINNMPTQVIEMLGTYEIKNNQRNVFSLSLSNYTYHDHAAHGMTYIKSLTFDLQEGKLCELEDLFQQGSDYIERLSTLIKLQIKQREIQLLDEFNAILPNQDFYVADKVLVIYFQLYEITPYYYGFPMFPISVYDLQDIINENGPLGRMAVNN